MPLYKSIEFKGSTIYIWKIEEPLSFFEVATGLSSDIKHPKRRLEYYAGRYVLAQLVDNIDLSKLSISSIGKPFLVDGSCHFSISHSYPYVAVAVHKQENIGLDIQVYRDKIIDLRPKFTHETEYALIGKNLIKTTLLWNAKEALFKWRGTGGQDFSEQLRIIQWQSKDDTYFEIVAKVIDLDKLEHNISGLGFVDPNFSLVVCVAQG